MVVVVLVSVFMSQKAFPNNMNEAAWHIDTSFAPREYVWYYTMILYDTIPNKFENHDFYVLPRTSWTMLVVYTMNLFTSENLRHSLSDTWKLQMMPWL